MIDLGPRTVHSRVRPGFRRAAAVLVIILLPVAAHALWDVIEMRRLVREIEAIRAKGEPVTEQEAGRSYSGGTEDHRRASQQYLAAAMLALQQDRLPSVVTDVHEWLSGVTPLRGSRRAAADSLKVVLDKERDALALVDTANQLEFRGFFPGTEYNYRAAGLWQLSHLLAARTLYLSLTEDPKAAARSALGSLTLRRVLRRPTGFVRSTHEIPAILSLSSPSRETLQELQAALEREEASHRPEEDIAAQRAWAIERVWSRYYGIDPRAPRNYSLPMRSVLEWAWRPWFTHEVVETLRVWNELLEAARQPWPQKIKSTAEVASRYYIDGRAKPGRSSFPPRDLMRNFIYVPAQGVDASTLILDRSALVALAVERFRRDHGGALPRGLAELVPAYLKAVPMDPVSGVPLLYRQRPDAYMVYSVGADEKDDGGDLTSQLEQAVARGWGPRAIRGRDVGVRIVIH